ncbi:MAG: hypothetical protein WAR83_15250 [Flavobacteriales bacterium]|jgi:hypothetical protein|nr:hypothetical protein [Flavobacteriales bacterium]
MKSSFLNPVLLALALSASIAAYGEGVGRLHLKVDLRIEAVLLDEARIILLPENGEAKLMENLGTSIDFDLDLGTSYLIEFQRPGCVSRQLMVDTRVAGNASVTSLIAQANMKLVIPKRGQDFEFDGPVGYIYFNETAGSFLYHTDYRAVGEQYMVDRMNTEREHFARPDALVVVPKRGYVIHPGYEYGTKVATGVNNAPLVHRTGRHTPEDEFIQFTEKAPFAILVTPPEASVALSIPAPIAPMAAVSEPAQPIAASVMDVHTINEELIVSRSRIIKEVKVLRDGRTSTYRKVTERYGAVYYFKDGVSCSEHVYRFGTSPDHQKEIPVAKSAEVTCSR